MLVYQVVEMLLVISDGWPSFVDQIVQLGISKGAKL